MPRYPWVVEFEFALVFVEGTKEKSAGFPIWKVAKWRNEKEGRISVAI